MTTYDFDGVADRRPTSSSKWNKYPPAILPFWVADMDFKAPDFILQGLRDRIGHGIIGYTVTPPGLEAAFVDWLERGYGWTIDPQWLAWLPGVVTGFNLAARAAIQPGDGILIPKPVYYPFLEVPANTGGRALLSDLVLDGGKWVMDFDDLSAKAVDASLFMLCNPQNPTGRVYSRQELTQLAQLCLRHDLVLMSDEIHCPLILDESAAHIPIATLVPELLQQTITLFSPTKAYNIPGLGCAVAVIPDSTLRARFVAARGGIVSGIGPLAYLACELAWSDRGTWLPAMIDYLRGNETLVRDVAGSRMTPVEGTYLAWIDIRDLKVQDVQAHFLKHGLGPSFGEQFGGPGFIRFNFGCPRPTLREGLNRLDAALHDSV